MCFLGFDRLPPHLSAAAQGPVDQLWADIHRRGLVMQGGPPPGHLASVYPGNLTDLSLIQRERERNGMTILRLHSSVVLRLHSSVILHPICKALLLEVLLVHVCRACFQYPFKRPKAFTLEKQFRFHKFLALSIRLATDVLTWYSWCSDTKKIGGSAHLVTWRV